MTGRTLEEIANEFDRFAPYNAEADFNEVLAIAQGQREELERLRADRVKYYHIAEVLAGCPASCRIIQVYAKHQESAQELTQQKQ